MSHLKLLTKRLREEKTEVHGYNTRHQQISIKSRESIYVAKALNFFNKLPSSIKGKVYDPIFKKTVNHYIIQRCPYTIKEFLEE